MTIRVSVILFRGASGSKKLRPLIDSLAHSTEGGVVRFIGTIEGDRTRRPVGKVSECEIVTRRLPRSGRHRVHRSDFGEPWKLIAMDDNPYKSPETNGESRSPLIKVWSYPAFCIVAILIPSALGAVALIADMCSATRLPVVVHSVVCLALGVWTMTVLVLNKVSRRRP